MWDRKILYLVTSDEQLWCLTWVFSLSISVFVLPHGPRLPCEPRATEQQLNVCLPAAATPSAAASACMQQVDGAASSCFGVAAKLHI